jgi:hypothetical protein
VNAHPREHQDFVDRLLGGALDEGDASVRARLESCPACRAELERMRALDACLHATARQARDDVERARSQAMLADEALVRDSLRAALSAGRSARLLLLACAAGLLVLLGLGATFYLRSRAGPAEILLRGGSILCLGPVDAVDDYDAFFWNATLPAQGSFELRIRSLVDDEAGPLLETIQCQEPRWTPTVEEKRALPDRIYWSVESRDVTERPVDSGWAKAWRRRSR